MAPPTPWFELAPDWVCEIQSPSTARRDRILKMPRYARAGVGHVWLVSPTARLLEVYRLHEGRWLLLGAFDGTEPVRAEPFEAVELELAGWWLPEEGDEKAAEQEQAKQEGHREAEGE